MKTFLLAVFSLFALAGCGGGGGGGGGGSLSVETPVLQVCKANERLVGDRCAPILADAPTKSCDGAKPILTDGGECRERRASDCVGVTPDFVNGRCEAACPSGQTRNSGVCESLPTTKRCADGLEIALDAVCMKDCNGGRILESEICPPPTKRCADGLDVALDAVCMKDCNGGRIPESDICPPPTKRCADGLEVALDAVCMKDCNGGRIPESEICPPPTKRCADGLEVALNAVCMKDCNGGRIPESEICPPPTKRCADGLEVALNAVCMKDCNGGRIPESEICPPPTKRCADGVEVAVDTVCRKHCNGGLIPESEICPPPPTTKRCADGLEIALSAVCMKDCNGGRIPESEICPTTKRCADGLEVALDAVCMKHCNGGRIPESEICPTTKRCADGLEIAIDAVCMKDCNGGRIPESEICPPPTKRCADGLEIAIDAVCMKDCNGGRIPESEICPTTKRCADGLEIAIDAVCMKDCNGGRIPESEICPTTKRCADGMEIAIDAVCMKDCNGGRIPEAHICPSLSPMHHSHCTADCAAGWSLNGIQAGHAYARGYFGQGVTVGIYEFGILATHEDLISNVVITSTIYDPNPKAFIASNPPGNYHANPVLGIVVAKRNGKGTHGVAPQAKAIPAAVGYTGIAYQSKRHQIPIFNFSRTSWRTPFQGTFRGVQYIKQFSEFFPDITVPHAQGVLGAHLPQSYKSEIAYIAGGLEDSDQVWVFSAGNGGFNSVNGRVPLYKCKGRFSQNPAQDGYCDDGGRTGFEVTLVPIREFLAEFNDVAYGNLSTLNLLGKQAHGFGHAPHIHPKLEDNILIVASVGRNLIMSEFSDGCGAAKDWCLVAPGEGVYVVGPRTNTDYYHGFEGTSGSAPHVSGALAVMKSAAQEISITVHRRILLTTATDLGAPGVDIDYGHGMVNLSAAIDMIEARKTPPMDGLFRSFSPSELGDMLPSEFAHLGDKIGDAEIAVKLADDFYYNAPLSKLLRPTAKAKTPLGDIGAEMTAPIIAASSSGFAAAGDGENNFALRWNGLGENTALMAEYAQSESESGIWEKSASGKILLRRNLFGGLSAFGEYERKHLQSDIGGGGFLAGTDNAQADGWLAGMEWTADERGKSRFRFWAKERMRLSGGDLIMRYPHYDGDLRVREKRVPLREKGERIWSAGYASAMGVGGEWTAAAAYNSGTGEKKLSARWEWELR